MSENSFDMAGRECPNIFNEPCPGASIKERPGGCPWWRDQEIKRVTYEGKNRVERTETWTGCGILMRDELELGVAQEVHAAWQAIDDMVKTVKGVQNTLAATQIGLAEAMVLKTEPILRRIKEADKATGEGRSLLDEAAPLALSGKEGA